MFPPNVEYAPNPDTVVNQHGRTLINIMKNYSLMTVNGYKNENVNCDSKFTYYKGSNRSQNDLCICNNIQDVIEFKILDKVIYSDHCPVSLSIDVENKPSLSLISECAKDNFKYNHLDINRQLRKGINPQNIDASKLMDNLSILAEEIDQFQCNDINRIANHITDGIYKACKDSVRKLELTNLIPNENCTSKHMKAISEAHFYLYSYKVSNNANIEEITCAASKWWDYHCLAVKVENKECNTHVNKKWQQCKKDGKTLWQQIDWKGGSTSKKSTTVEPECIDSY